MACSFLAKALYRTPPQTGRFLTPQQRRQTADGSLQQTQAVKIFHRNLLPSAVCNLPSMPQWKQSKNDQFLAGGSISPNSCLLTLPGGVTGKNCVFLSGESLNETAKNFCRAFSFACILPKMRYNVVSIG